MKYSTRLMNCAVMLTLGAGIWLLPLMLSAQTASPSPATTVVEEQAHHDYGWIGLLGLLGLAGLARRKPAVNVAERTSAPRP
jgi:MYXO-CTERM domain-containing protein